MTPAERKHRPNTPSAPASPSGDAQAATGFLRVVAAVLVRSGQVFAAVGDTGEGVSSFRLRDARKFSIADTSSFRAFLKDAGVGLVVRLAPLNHSLARTTTLPDGASDGPALAEALALIAESEMPAQLPWYRRAGGRIRARSANGSGTAFPALALLVGWHTAGSPPVDPLADALEGFRQLWTTESVALANLLPTVPGATAGARWIASIDSVHGAMAIVASVNDRSAARVLRLPAEESKRAVAIDTCLRETLAALGDESPVTHGESEPHAVFSSAGDNAVHIAGQARDASWIAQFAIPAAAVETFSDPDPAVRAFFNLHAVEPRRRLGLLQGAIVWLAKPARAAAIIALCVACFLAVPLGVAYARHTMLRDKVAGVKGLDSRLAAEEQRVAFYALLRERRWPMTKLLADIAASTPEGITLDVLEVNQGEPITLRGTAKTNDLVTRFRSNLAQTRVFDNIATPNVGTTADGVQFQLQARVAPNGAIYRGTLADDFAKKPLGVRIYGKDYVAPPSGAAGAPATSGSAANEGSRGSPRSEIASGRASRSPSPAAPASKAEVPAPLSDAEIAGFERGRVIVEWAKRKTAANRAEDPAVKARLLEEVEKLDHRKNEIDRKGAAK